MLVRVVAPHFVAGLVVEDGKVTEAAPILRYTLGWPQQKASRYFRSKGWKAHILQCSLRRTLQPLTSGAI